MMMAYRKAILEIENEILTLKHQNQKLLDDNQQNNRKEKYYSKKDEFDSKVTNINKTGHEIEESKSNAIRMSTPEIKQLYDKYQAEKQEVELIKNELDSLEKALTESLKEENRKYIELIIDRKILKEKILLLEKNLDKKPLEDVIKLQAAEKKLEFHTNKNDIQIELHNEKITGKWSDDKDQEAIAIMVELYLKAIENQNVDKHLVEGKNSRITKQIERELAKELKGKGLEKGEINNKKIDEILTSIETSAEELASPKH